MNTPLFFLLATAVVLLTSSAASAKNNNNNNKAEEKTKVHIMVHSHDDVGWLKNPDQYLYGLNMTIQNAHVNAIISSVVAALAVDPARRYTQVETWFFEQWWHQQTAGVKQTVRKLVAEGRLTFACGGMTMPDEAAPLYPELIDQYTAGHRFLMRELNATVNVGSQLDPFGHSAFHAYLNAEAGFDGVYFARMSFDEYDWRAATKGREFWWYPSKSQPNAAIFTGALLGQTYCPWPGVSWDLNDELGSCFQNSDCPQHQFVVDKPGMEQNNVKMYADRVVGLAEQYRQQTADRHVLLPLGCDFQQAAASWDFDNAQKLINLLNADGRVEAQFSTLHDYTLAKLNSKGKFPNRGGDIFPYQDGFSRRKGHNWWSGYFTSRPALKRYVRQVSSYYTASRQLRALLLAPPAQELDKIARATGTMTHHDAVAGTAKQHVAFWYAQYLYAGYEEDLAGVKSGAAARLNATLVHCPRLNESECEATASTASLADGVVVMVWNPDAHERATMWVQVPVPVATVYCTGGAVVEAKVVDARSQGTSNYGHNSKSQPFMAHVLLKSVPAAGFTTFEISSTKQHDNSVSATTSAAPKQQKQSTSEQLPALENEFFKLTFGAHGLASMTDKSSGNAISLQQDFCYYKSNAGDNLCQQAGGAYIMRAVTDSPCYAVNMTSASLVFSDSSSLSVVELQFGTWATARVSVAKGKPYFDIDFTVMDISIADSWGKEFMLRLRTNISSNAQFFTDSNGRDFMPRQRNHREYPPADYKGGPVLLEELAQNMYPVNSAIGLNDTKSRFVVMTDTSVAGGSVHDGELYLDVHRRLLVDDNRGVGEPLNETEFVNPYVSCWQYGCPCGGGTYSQQGQHCGPFLRVRGTFRVVLESASASYAKVRSAMDHAFYHPQLLFSEKRNAAGIQRAQQRSILTGSLPDALQLITFQLLPGARTILLRLGNKYAVGEGADAPVTVTLRNLINDKIFGPVSNIEQVSITTQFIQDNNVRTATLGPMQIRTFLVHLE